MLNLVPLAAPVGFHAAVEEWPRLA